MNSAELPLIPEEPHPAFDLRQSRPSSLAGRGRGWGAFKTMGN
jgi:hypothetical protein